MESKNRLELMWVCRWGRVLYLSYMVKKNNFRVVEMF